MMSVVSFAQKAPTAATQTLLQKTMRVSNVQAKEFGAFQFNMPMGKIDTQSSRMLNPNLFKMSTTAAANHRSLRAESDYPIIYDQPEGELKTYDRFGGYYILDGSSVYYDDQSGSIDIVWGTDGKVYFKDILSGLPIGTWVYGELSSDGTTITVPLNQNLIYISDYDCCLAIRLINYASGVGFTVDTETASVVFTVDGDLISMQGTGLASVSLGAIWTDDLSIYDLGDYETVYALQAPKETIDVDKAVFYDDFESGDLAKWTLYTQGEGEGWYDSDLSQFSVGA